MPSRRLHHGLAATAVAALALGGLVAPLTPAAAADVSALRLIAPYNAERAISFDSEAIFSFSTAVRLVAETADPEAPTTFEWNANPGAGDTDDGWVAIPDPVTVTGTYASVDWTSGNGSAPVPSPGAQVALRAVSSPSAGVPSYSTLNDVRVAGDDDSTPPVELDVFAGLGFFTQPYADSGRTRTVSGVTGETSTTEGTVELSRWRTGAGTFQGVSRAQVVRDPDKDPDEPANGTFSRVVDMRPFAPADGKDVVIGAELGTDHASPTRLYRQQLTSVQADVTPGRRGEDTAVELLVSDQDGRPVAGAEVFRAASGAAPRQRIGFTDAEGEVATTQRTGSTRAYYANVDDGDAYRADVDPTTGPVQAPRYEPEASELRAYLADGDVFDLDEYAPGDVAVEVLDQQGRPMGAGVSIEYRVDERGESSGQWLPGTTDGTGRVPVSPEELEGVRGGLLEYRFPGSDFVSSTVFSTGQAELSLSRTGDGPVASGGAQAWRGTLTLDGEPLVGRVVDLDYRRGVENVPGAGADAGLVVADGVALSDQVVTRGDGSFQVVVTDARERGNPAELGGRVTASTGDTVPTAESTLAGNADARDSDRIDFGSGKGAVSLGRSGAGNGAKADRVTVTGPASVAGEKVRFVRVGAQGGRTELAVRRLDAKGDRSMSFADRNGTRTTTYVVELLESRRVQPGETDPISLR